MAPLRSRQLVPWLAEQDREFEGAPQTVWDRQLSARPVLLILVGRLRLAVRPEG